MLFCGQCFHEAVPLDLVFMREEQLTGFSELFYFSQESGNNNQSGIREIKNNGEHADRNRGLHILPGAERRAFPQPPRRIPPHERIELQKRV